MKAPVISLPQPAVFNSISEIGIRPTNHVSDTGEAQYRFMMDVRLHEKNTHTGGPGLWRTELCNGEAMTASRAAASLAIMTRQGSGMRYSKDMKIKPDVFMLRSPSLDFDSGPSDIERREKEIRERIEAVLIPQVQELLMASRKLLVAYPSLANEPDKLANAANGYMIAKAEREEIDASMKGDTPAPRMRPAPRM